MKLGLLDILTAQQADSPDFSRRIASDPARQKVQQMMDDRSGAKFSDHLTNRPRRSENDTPAPEQAKTSNYGVSGSDNKHHADGRGNADFGHAQKDGDEQSDASSVQNIQLAQNAQNTQSDNSANNQSDLFRAIKQYAAEKVQIGSDNAAGSGDTSNAQDVLQDKKEGLTQVFNVLKQIKDNGGNLGGQNPLSALLALQEAGNGGNTATDTVPLSEILSKFKQGVSTDGVKTTMQTGTTADTNAQTVDASLIANGNNATEQALQNLQLEAQDPQNGETTQNTQTAAVTTGEITQIAGSIINVAKDQAEAPNVAQTDVKSGQIESMLKSKKSKDDKDVDTSSLLQGPVNNIGSEVKTVATNNGNGGHNNNGNAANKGMEHNAANIDAFEQNLQSQTDNDKAAAADKALQAAGAKVEDAAKQVTQNAAPQHQVSSNSVNKLTSDFLGQPQSQHISGDIPPTGDFVKLQKYIDTVSNNINNMGTMKGANPADVMAQIKFGMNTMGVKGDSKISIQLHPKELGSVDVHMEVSKDGKTKVAIVAEKADTLNLLQKEAGSLKELLRDALQTDSSNLSFTFHGQGDDRWRESMNGAFGGSSYGRGAEENDDSTLNAMAAYGASMYANSGLDIRV